MICLKNVATPLAMLARLRVGAKAKSTHLAMNALSKVWGKKGLGLIFLLFQEVLFAVFFNY